ncbi:MAG: glycoside hydrolase family 35 protein [Janthinobacterium lividum]
MLALPCTKLNSKARYRQAGLCLLAVALGSKMMCAQNSRSRETIAAVEPSTASTPLMVSPQGLVLRGKPFRIVSGELEYARIPRADWRDRLQKARAMGLNAVTMYVFWNLHEPEPGKYDFSGQNDVAAFVREAQAQGLYVILRPGPYVCAEWDLGGYPAWLLKDHSMLLRSRQPQYMAAASRWMHRLGEELAPLQASLGGPILAVQVENEYGSFGNDRDYLQEMYTLVRASGFSRSLLYTADGADVLAQGSLPGVFAGIDFGTGDAKRSIDLLAHTHPDGPVYVAEYWDGWFDHWGEMHQTTDAAKQEAEIRSMLEAGDSLNLYMVQGGTSFGWMNGANSASGQYQPDVSSYDYDAPLDEAGRPTPKYLRIRDIIAEATHTTPLPVPASAPLISLPPINLSRSRSLWKTLPAAIASPTPLSMEDVGQSYGYLLYRTHVQGSGLGELAFHELHSYARVYVDGQWVGTVDRRLGQQSLPLDLDGTHQLDILVENSGRINFTPALRGERAGLTGEVTLGGRPVRNWEMVPLPLTLPPSEAFAEGACAGPCLYEADFSLTQPGDTFLNTEALSKGVIWVNGHLLGRFWDVGPMGSLYLPGAWLHAGQNQIVVLDLNGGAGLTVAGQDHPTYVHPRPETTPAGASGVRSF